MSALPLPTTQSAIRFHAFGTPDVLAHETELPLPTPGPGEVRIRVEASCVQFTDTLIRMGRYPDLRDPPPVTPGYDVVGRVDALGEGVTNVAVGDRVADLTMIGSHAQFTIRPAAGLVPVPESVDAAEASTLILSWLTAQQALFRAGELKPHQRVLITGGNGAVGQAAIVLAKQAGAEVFATAGTRHHALLRELGATPLPREDWLPSVRGTMDVVLDGIAADRFRSPFAALKRGGRLVAIGTTALASGPLFRIIAAAVTFVWLMVAPNGRKARFYSITAHRKRHPEAFRTDLAALMNLLANGQIRPHVARRIRFDEVAQAHRDLEAGGLTGKIVLLPKS